MTVGEPSGDLAGHVGGGCTTVHPQKELFKDDGPRKGPQANMEFEEFKRLRRSRCITYAVLGKDERRKPRKGVMHRAHVGV